eukprot:897547_1
MGLQHSFEGAMTRLHNLKNQLNLYITPYELSHIVSVENGVECLTQHEGTIGIDIACVIINVLNEDNNYIAFSQGRPYPIETIQNMKRNGISNEEIGTYCA